MWRFCLPVIALLCPSVWGEEAPATGGPCSLDRILNSAFMNKVEKKVGAAPEWEIPEALTHELLEYWRTSAEPLEDKLRHTYQKVLAARVDTLNPASQAFVKLAGRRLLEKNGWYQRSMGLGIGAIVGPHYNPIFNSVYLSRKTGKLSDVVIAIHEMEHAVDRNSSLLAGVGTVVHAKESLMLFPTPLGPLNRFAMESRAIGAQWELMQRIPESVRLKIRSDFIKEARLKKVLGKDAKDWFKDWSKNGDPEAVSDLENHLLRMDAELGILEQITERSLLNASLSKEKFIREMRTLHGYTLKKIYQRHYGASGLRLSLTATSIFGASMTPWKELPVRTGPGQKPAPIGSNSRIFGSI